MSNLNLCYGCMEPLGDESVCKHCGYDQNTAAHAGHLKPGTVLHERFTVGRALAANGEGITYIAYDNSVGCKVLVREYMPQQLCSRVPDSAEINVSYERLAQYKALMAEYTELNKALARLRNLSHLNPALDLFAENNTTYAVYEYLEGRTLLEYLKENAGELSWNVVRRIFPPLFTTLSLLHNAGVLHRGISPETIFVTDKGELKLLGFCISAVRTNDTELDAELFDGYAAPEQYFADRQQGTWTDVYGICAVLYRILTGARATDAISRQDYDNLVPPAELNPHVPENVSQGIMQGLALDGNARVRTITDLVTILFESEPVQEEKQESIPAEPKKKDATAVYSTKATAQAQRRAQQQRQGGSAARVNAAKNAASRQQGRTGQRSANGGGKRPQNGQRRPANGTARPHSGQTGRVPQHNRPANRQQRPAQSRNVSTSRNGQSAKAKEITVFERIRAPLLIAFLFIAIVTLVVMAFIHLMDMNQGNQQIANKDSSREENVVPVQPAETTAAPVLDYVMPNFVGQSFPIKRDEVASWLNLEPVYEFSEVFYKDQIMWQELEPDSEFAGGSTVQVGVSLGPSRVEIPSYKNFRLNAYLDELKKLGFVEGVDGGGDSGMAAGNVGTQKNESTTTTTKNANGKKQSVIYKAKTDYNYTTGYVCGVDPAPGTVVDALEDYEIIVYYAYNPVFTTIGNGTTGTGTTTSTGKTSKTSKTSSTTETSKTTKATTSAVGTTAPPQTTTQEVVVTQPPQTTTQEPVVTTQAPVQTDAPPAADPDE